MHNSAIIILLLSVALCPSLVSAQDWNRTDLTDAALIGIIVGAVFFVVVVVAIIFMCLCFLGSFQGNDNSYAQPIYMPGPPAPYPPLPPPEPYPDPYFNLPPPEPQPSREQKTRPVYEVTREIVQPRTPDTRRVVRVARDRDDYEQRGRDDYEQRGRGDYERKGDYY